MPTVFIATFYQYNSWNFNTCLDRLGLDEDDRHFGIEI